MLKFALALGISFEWLVGPSVNSLPSLGYAGLRSVCATLFAWMVLECGRVLFLGAMSLEDLPPQVRRPGARR
jgi:hypothetical protein